MAELSQVELLQMLRQQNEALIRLTTLTTPQYKSSFEKFDENKEIITDYFERFTTFVLANSIPKEKHAQIFISNQSAEVHKLLSTICKQKDSALDVNALTIEEVYEMMVKQFDPAKFVISERYKFWSNTERKPGETIKELAARIRQEANKCKFENITNPLDEAMRTKFVCTVKNEAVLKILFRMKDTELTFDRAVEVAIEAEEAAKCAKETVHQENSVKKINNQRTAKTQERNFAVDTCGRCGKKGHQGNVCRYKEFTCRSCHKKGHLERVCLSKKDKIQRQRPSYLKNIRRVKQINSVPPITQDIVLDGKKFSFEIDTGAAENFMSENIWQKLGKPKLNQVSRKYESASGDQLKVLGSLKIKTDTRELNSFQTFIVVKGHKLNLLGRTAIKTMKIEIDSLFNKKVYQIKNQESLSKLCKEVCREVPQIFEPGLGLLKNFELDIKFKPDAQPVFMKPRNVPYAIREDLSEAYEAGISTGVWKQTQFNAWGTPVVPIRKKAVAGKKAQIRVCGDYTKTVNPQLETHRYTMPMPEDLMRKLAGGHYFSKIDLADAYNQIKLTKEAQERLALSTHKGVLLQTRLPFGITSAPAYFQEIMDKLTQDLPGVAVYMDDILVSGQNEEDHINNIRRLLHRLDENGLKCRLEKCIFAQQSIEYLGHKLSNHGISKGAKVDAVLNMPAPTDIASLRSFLGQVQFYNKFLPDLSTVLESLYQLTRKNVAWCWKTEQEEAFQKVKLLLSSDTVLAHYDPTQDIGIACDASNVGIGCVLFHRYPDGSERPIANVSKTLTAAQRKYSQIQKEALSIIFALSKFHQYLYARKFFLVTDHRPLISIFGTGKGTPTLAANRLARWALTLSQYDYVIEFRKSSDHGNADALSRLPAGHDDIFDKEESEADTDSVCLIKQISLQIRATDPGVIARESQKDPTVSTVMRYCQEGWPSPTNKTHMNSDAANLAAFKNIQDSLSVESNCLFYGSRIVVPKILQTQVLQILHTGHFGIERMKHLARSAVYWPGLDAQITELCRTCQTCAEHARDPSKASIHPWMLPEKPWSRVHIDHAINFKGSDWLIMIDAYSKYPCIHKTTSTSTKATTDILEEDFAHFGYPHTIVSDNATSFISEEFQEWCKRRGIVHLAGAPYHPATNGAAERLIQSFKSSVKKSTLPVKEALQDFLRQYRRTPLASGLSPSQLLNNRQIRTMIDTLAPSPAHQAQGRQLRDIAARNETNKHSKRSFLQGDPCYVKTYGATANSRPRWAQGTISKVMGPRLYEVKLYPGGPTWKRHLDQLRPRYGGEEDDEPAMDQVMARLQYQVSTPSHPTTAPETTTAGPTKRRTNPRRPDPSDHPIPRRSQRQHKVVGEVIRSDRQ